MTFLIHCYNKCFLPSDFPPECLNFVAYVSLGRSFLHVQSFIYIHSFIHSSIVHDVYVCVYMHSHVSYGVDMEVEGQLKGVGSLLQPFD